MYSRLEPRVQEAHYPTTAATKKMEEKLEQMMQSLNNQRVRRIKAKARYREKYPEKIVEARERYREKNTNKIAESKKRYNETNREKVRAYQKQYREKHRERIRAYHRRYGDSTKGISREKC